MSEKTLCALKADLKEYKEGIEVERGWKREAYRRNRQLRTENKMLRSYKKEVEDIAELMFQFMMQRLHE